MWLDDGDSQTLLIPTGERSNAGDYVQPPIAKDLIDHVYAMKLGLKLWNNKAQEASGLVNAPTCQADGASWFHGDRGPSTWNPSRPLCLAVHCILYNNCNLSHVRWVVLVNYWTWESIAETLQFVVIQAEVQVAWRPHVQLVSEVGALLWNWALKLGGLCWLWVVSVTTELNCWTPSWCWRISCC